MNLDARTFRRTMGLFATGVTVLGVEHDGRVHGMTANAVTALSLDPLLLLVCVDRRAQMAELLGHAAGFSLNVLRDEQQSLSTLFAGGWRDPTPPPFRFVPWEGGPRLEGCAAALGCLTHERFAGGDHWIVCGRVIAAHEGVPPVRPLVFFGGRYCRLDLTESAPAPDLDAFRTPGQVFYDPWLKDD